MSYHSASHDGRVVTLLLAVSAVLWSACPLAAAQDPPVPKWELYGGYSFFYPGADVHGVLPGGLLPVSSRLESNPRGAGASLTYNFSRWFGLTLDGSTHWGSGEAGLGKRLDDAAFSNLSFGPKITFRTAHFSPFLEALVGDHRLMPDAFHDVDKLGVLAGGGLDINVSRHVALRLIRADYLVSSYSYGPAANTPKTDLRGARLQAGIVLMWGGEPALTPVAACSALPAEVFAGDPVTTNAVGSNFNPKRTVKYSWTGPGGKPAGTEASTTITTTSLQPGSYQASAALRDGSKKGLASCTAAFLVKAPRPPVISCAADPASVPTGGTSTIRSTASSPDGRNLTYSFTTSTGSITASASTATLDASGAPSGTATVTCNVADDRNPPLTASSSATVTVLAPPPAAAPEVSAVIRAIEKRLALHSVYFATAKPAVEHPDVGLLASQEKTLSSLADDFKTYLQSKPEARLILEGHADARGSVEYNHALSERRVDRTQRYLVEQGVPASSIQTEALGKQHNLTSAEVKGSVERNPELTPEDRRRVLNNMRTIILASNRRVDITLSNPGQSPQESVRQYPFNAADSLTLLKEEGTRKTTRPAARKKARPKGPR
jgi:outer membrane protein OmpA-like peptidoglycan-associated protein